MFKNYKQLVAQIMGELRQKRDNSIDALLKAITTRDTVIPEHDELLANVEAVLFHLKGDGVTDGKVFNNYTADDLSNIAGNLSILKDSIGEVQAVAQQHKDSAEAYLEFRKASIRDDIIKQLYEIYDREAVRKPTEADIVAEIRKQVYVEKMIFIFRETFYVRITNKLWSLNSILDVLDTRIKIELSNKADTKHYNNNLPYASSNVKEELHSDTKEDLEVEEGNWRI